jgi:hypothetical protein
MRLMNRLPITALVLLALGPIACEPAETDADGVPTAERSSTRATASAMKEPAPEQLLIPPPPGSEFQPEASEAEHEIGSGPSRYGSAGNFKAQSSFTYVYLADQSIEEVAHYFVRAREDSPHHIELDELFDFDGGGYTDLMEEDLDIQEDSPVELSPDEMQTMIEGFRDQGIYDEEEAKESLATLDVYRKLYPKIKDITVRSLEFEILDEDGGMDEYLLVDVELVRPYIDFAAIEVRDRTAIIYTVHHMKRQEN